MAFFLKVDRIACGLNEMSEACFDLNATGRQYTVSPSNHVCTALFRGANAEGRSQPFDSTSLHPTLPRGAHFLKLVLQLCANPALRYSKQHDLSRVDIQMGRLNNSSSICVCDVTISCKIEPLGDLDIFTEITPKSQHCVFCFFFCSFKFEVTQTSKWKYSRMEKGFFFPQNLSPDFIQEPQKKWFTYVYICMSYTMELFLSTLFTLIWKDKSFKQPFSISNLQSKDKVMSVWFAICQSWLKALACGDRGAHWASQSCVNWNLDTTSELWWSLLPPPVLTNLASAPSRCLSCSVLSNQVRFYQASSVSNHYRLWNFRR